ncbi:MAG: Rab family GTPase [Promethearchaeota archaeon]
MIDYTFKVLVLSDYGVGSTTLKKNHVIDLFPENKIVKSQKFNFKKKIARPKRFFLKCRVKRFLKKINKSKSISPKFTIGVDFCTKVVNLDEKNFKLQLWVFSNEERFKFLLPTYLRGSNAIIIIYDITNPRSLEKIPEWCQMAKNYRKDIPILLVGNKLDLEERRKVSKEQLNNNYDISNSMEISLKTGENVEQMFINIIKMIFEKHSL